jgi:Flp pilus assembly pilin Flp
MKLLNIFKSFKNDEAGAVTVDWVVLTAAIVGLGLVVMNTVGGAITDASDAVATDIGSASAAASGGAATP